MPLELNRPLAEMSTSDISWGLRRPVRRTDKAYHIHVPIVLKFGSLNLLEPSGHVKACNRIALPSIHILPVPVAARSKA
jgi:hypothetical protein